MRRTILVFAACLILLAGCSRATRNTAHDLVVITTLPGAEPVIDDRGTFSALFCSILDRTGPAGANECAHYLWQLKPERAPTSTYFKIPDWSRLHVLIIPGAFGECVAEFASPFHLELGKLPGLTFDVVTTEGRSGTARNAELIGEYFAANQFDPDRKLVVLAYSKGVSDMLQALVDESGIATRVDALISVSGSIIGSPIADKMEDTYASWVGAKTIAGCKPGDGKVVSALTRGERVTFLIQNPLPSNIQYYSIGSYADRKNISTALKSSHRFLSRIDPRNDGQLLMTDVVLPGSTLLGFVNADHWAVTLDLAELPGLAGMVSNRNDYPRGVLLEAMLTYVMQ